MDKYNTYYANRNHILKHFAHFDVSPRIFLKSGNLMSGRSACSRFSNFWPLIANKIRPDARVHSFSIKHKKFLPPDLTGGSASSLIPEAII